MSQAKCAAVPTAADRLATNQPHRLRRQLARLGEASRMILGSCASCTSSALRIAVSPSRQEVAWVPWEMSLRHSPSRTMHVSQAIQTCFGSPRAREAGQSRRLLPRAALGVRFAMPGEQPSNTRIPKSRTKSRPCPETWNHAALRVARSRPARSLELEGRFVADQQAIEEKAVALHARNPKTPGNS